MSFHIVTDTSADLPESIINKYNIEIVPMSIQIGEKTFKDQIELSNEALYNYLAHEDIFPKTSRPSPQYYIDVFEKLGKDAPILCITLSTGLSSSYESALMAKKKTNKPIEIIDSLNASIGVGLQVIKACELREQGVSFNNTIREVLNYRNQIKTFFTLDTLEYIVKGGRLSNWEGTIGQVLQIKPMLFNLPDGTIGTLEKVRGRKKSLKRLVQLIEACDKDFAKTRIGISHTQALEEAETVAEKLQNSLQPKEIIITELGPTIASHTGLGTILVAL